MFIIIVPESNKITRLVPALPQHGTVLWGEEMTGKVDLCFEASKRQTQSLLSPPTVQSANGINFGLLPTATTVAEEPHALNGLQVYQSLSCHRKWRIDRGVSDHPIDDNVRPGDKRQTYTTNAAMAQSVLS